MSAEPVTRADEDLEIALEYAERYVVPDSVIAKVGTELEGGWIELDRIARKASSLGIEGTTDASLPRYFTCGGSECACAADAVCTHEGRCDSLDCKLCQFTRGYELRVGGPTGSDLITVLRHACELYPTATHVRAAMHVHVSTREPLALTGLAIEDFFAYHEERWRAFARTACDAYDRARLIDRLDGRLVGTNYCQRNRAAEYHEGRALHEVDRYRSINFAAWYAHRTVEFRTLPLFRSRATALRAIAETIAIVEDYYSTERAAHKIEATIEPVTDASLARLMPADPTVIELREPTAFAPLTPTVIELREPVACSPHAEVIDLPSTHSLPVRSHPDAILVARRKYTEVAQRLLDQTLQKTEHAARAKVSR